MRQKQLKILQSQRSSTEGWSVPCSLCATGLRPGVNFGQSPVCSIPKHTSAFCLDEAAFTWGTACKEAGGQQGRLNSCMKQQRDFSAARFQMGSAWEGGARCSQESLCHSVLFSCSWPSLGTEQSLAPGLGALAQPGIDPSSQAGGCCLSRGWGNA